MGYKKRAKGNWNAGKSHKKESNKSERQYEKEEIQEEFNKLEAKDEYRTKAGGRKKKDKLSKLKKRIAKSEKHLRIFESFNLRSGIIDRIKSSIEKDKKKVQELESQRENDKTTVIIED